ncbi:unnamed protein product [Ixodes persulcatus]
MVLTGITLVLVSFAFFGSVAAHNCQNGTRPASYSNGDTGVCKHGECHLNTESGVPTDTEVETPAPTKKPKQKKKKQKKSKKPKGN